MPIFGFVVGAICGYWLKGTSVSPSIDKLCSDVISSFKNSFNKNKLDK